MLVRRLIAARSDSSAFAGSTTINSSQPLLSDSAMLAMWFCDASARSPSPASAITSSCKRFSSSSGNPFEQGSPRRGEVMLHRIAQGEKAAARTLQAVAQRDQFLPTIDRDQPVELQIAGEFLGVFQSEIRDIAVRPDERVKGLDVADRAAVFLRAGKPSPFRYRPFRSPQSAA